MSHYYYDEPEQEERVGLWTRLRNWFSRVEDEALDELRRGAGYQFREEVVEALERLVTAGVLEQGGRRRR